MLKIEKIWNKIWNKKNEKYYVSFGLIIVSLILSITLYKVCLERLISGFKDIGTSFSYYFSFFFGSYEEVHPTVNDLPNIEIGDFLPFDLDVVIAKLKVYWSVFFDGDTFLGYLAFLFECFFYLLLYGSLLVPSLVLIVYIVFNGYTERHIEFKKRKGKANLFFSWIMIGIKASCDYIRKYVDFLKNHKGIFGILLTIWLVNTNMITIAAEALAWYFYWVSSFDYSSIGTQIVKLVFDLIIMLWTLPGILWAIIGYKIFDFIRVNRAYDELRHLEAKNRGFINTLPVGTLITGTMAAGKSKTGVDICLSLQNEFRDRMLNFLDRNMMRFPNFDFMAFEEDLKEAIKNREIINLATARRWVCIKHAEYDEDPMPDKLWGYDLRKYKNSYNNGLELIGIWKCLENYAQEYFVYTLTTSLIISNIAIRCDLDPVDKGFFLSFNMDFFKRDPAKVEEYSAYAHIIDFDLFRVTCQMNKENDIAGSFEFGIVFIDEFGKERQNMLELKEVKKNSVEANQKNDGFNPWVKVSRHGGTIEGFSLVRIVSAEQRPESLGADLRDLFCLLSIVGISERRSTLKFSILPDFFMSVVCPKYLKWYNKVKKYGNENVPLIKNLHRLVSCCYNYSEKRQNIFGYQREKLRRRMGDMSEEYEECVYYLMDMKIYAGRYWTDCLKGVFATRALEVGTSLYFMKTYQTSCATLDELKSQNSYFVNDVMKMYRSDL